MAGYCWVKRGSLTSSRCLARRNPSPQELARHTHGQTDMMLWKAYYPDNTSTSTPTNLGWIPCIGLLGHKMSYLFAPIAVVQIRAL